MLESLLLTLRLALLASLTLLLLAGPLAWLLAWREFRGRGLLETVLLLPLVLPPTVLGFYLLLLLGKNGPLSHWFGLTLAFTFTGILIGSVVFNLPTAISNYREAFRSIDPDLIATARTLGAGRARVLREVILPLAAPGLFSGTLLVFAQVLGEFGVVLMIGGSIPGQTQVLSIYIYQLTEALQLREANQAALLMLGLAFGLLYSIRRLEARWKSRRGVN
ncbi:MAG: molybdate ABC transporter permease subunit [Thermaceae bacterium]|nr:molybdate ABC transporter permease subunit [Thermaceae bacterium]